MLNLKLEIEYDGTRFHGWQSQNGTKARLRYSASKTIQNILEQTLKKILREDIRLTAAGRTDAGVHAVSQVANFRTRSKMPMDKMRWGLNCLLPAAIKVASIRKVPADFNSRFRAKSKIYRYTILNRKYSSAFLANHVYFFPHHLDTALMRREVKALVGKHNFKSFQASQHEEKNPVRTIKSIKISRVKDFVHIDIEADGFLYNMARNIAGTLLEIGRGRFPAGSMRKVLEARDRRFAGPTLPAKGLCLMKVRY